METSHRIGTSATADFRRRKLFLALGIMGLGLIIALAWAAFQGCIRHRGYPHNTFLYPAKIRFTDFTDATLIASYPFPYFDPGAFYLPFAQLCLRPLYFVSIPASIIGIYFVSLGGLLLILDQVFAPVVAKPALRTFCMLLLLLISYPAIFCFDRGNIEIFMVLLVSGAIFFMTRARYLSAVLCLIPAISLKIYPVILLLFLLRQRKVPWAVCTLLVATSVTLLSLYYLSLPIDPVRIFYARNMTFFTDYQVYMNFTLGGGASPWNAFKVFLIAAGKLRLIAPFDFNYDGSVIRSCYAVYSAGMLLVTVALVIYILFLEREFLRGVISLLLFLSISVPSGSDYRLLYAGIALVILILLKTRRPADVIILVLLALVMVPKKEILLPFAGETETGFWDVSIQVLLNPLFVLSSLFLLLNDGRAQLDLRWSRLRFFRLVRAIIPRLPAKTS